MAEPKKDGKKGDKKKGDKKRGWTPASNHTWILFAIVLGLVVIYLGIAYISKFFGYSSVSDFGNAVLVFIANLIEPIAFISVFLCLLFGMGIIYTSFLTGEIKKEAKSKIESGRNPETGSESKMVDVSSPRGAPNPKWITVQNHINSVNPNDWRLAIIEADIMLEEMLEKMGYKGEGVGEMLKTVEKSDFHTLDEAWEAHKVRNNIAHQGSDYVMSSAEAKRAVGKFQRVFEEFYYI